MIQPLQVVSVICESAVSSRKVKALSEMMKVEKISRSRVSRLVKSLDEECDDLVT